MILNDIVLSWNYVQVPPSSIAPTPQGGPTSGDGSPAAATEMFSTNALWNLSILAVIEGVGWLRGILGTYDGYHTLTVWGKLSWGADPLVASSPADGIADGARVNPLYTVGLYVIGLNASQTNLANGAGYAVQLTPTNSSTQVADYTNYSSEALVNNNTIPTIKNYSAVLPVPQTARQITLALEVVYKAPGGAIIPLPINGSSWLVDFTYDLVAGRFVKAFSVVGTNGSSGPKASLTINLQSVAMGLKDPTFLWVPTTNSTLNGLPLGLERYTGEQSFDLVVVNASSAYTSDSIPLPWGGTYTVTVQPGLNNFLIPREQFLESPFGNGVLSGAKLSYPTSNPNAPILGDQNSSASAAESTLSPFGGNQSNELEAYWQNRAIATTPGNFSSYESGTPNTSALQLRIAVASTPSSSNVGGLPANPTLLNSSNANAPTAALQSIVTLNITTTTTLDLLLSGLITNTTAGSNGTFQLVTAQVPFMGFDIPILDGLANTTVTSDGVYGVPAGQAPPPTPPSGLTAFFNNPVGVIESVAGKVVSIVEHVMTVALSSQIFQDALFVVCPLLGAVVLLEKSGALAYVEKLVMAALDAFLSWLSAAVVALFQQVVSAVESADRAYTSALASMIWQEINDTGHGTSIPPADAAAFWRDDGGTMLELCLGMSLVVLVAVDLVMGFSLGAGFVVGIVIGLIVSAALQATIFTPASFSHSAYGGHSVQGPALLWVGTGQLNLSGLLNQQDSQYFMPAMDVLAQDVPYLLSTASTAATIIPIAFFSQEPDLTTWVAVGLGLLAMFTFYASQQWGNGYWTAVSILTDIESLACDVTAIEVGGGSDLNAILNFGTLGLDAATFYLDAKDGHI